MQPENRSFVWLLRSPLTPFDSANFTKNGNCFEECNVFGNGKCELSAIHDQEGRETKVQFFGKEKCRTLRQYGGANFWKGNVQNSSPILARKW